MYKLLSIIEVCHMKAWTCFLSCVVYSHICSMHVYFPPEFTFTVRQSILFTLGYNHQFIKFNYARCSCAIMLNV
jgi:hypothetical protein